MNGPVLFATSRVRAGRRSNICDATTSYAAAPTYFVLAGHHDLLSGHHGVSARSHSRGRGIIYSDATTRRVAASSSTAAGHQQRVEGRLRQRHALGNLRRASSRTVVRSFVPRRETLEWQANTHCRRAPIDA